MTVKNKKRVIVFCMSYYPRFVGGAEVALKEITDHILQEDLEFYVVTLRYDSLLPRYEKIGNTHVYRIGFSRKSPLLSDLRTIPLRLNKLLYQCTAPIHAYIMHRKNKFDCAWAIMAHSAGVPGNMFSRMTSVPLVLTLQEGDPLTYIEKQMKIFGDLFLGVFRQAKKIHAISRPLAAWALQHGAAEDNVCIIPNAVDTTVFKKREEYVYERKIRIVTTSRLVPKNGIDILIHALSLLPEYVHLDIVGDGYQFTILQRLVTGLQLQNRIVFHGQKNQGEMYNVLAEAFVFCRPSRSEGLGNSFLESMAVGVPVIGTRIGGITDFLIDIREDAQKGNSLLCRIENKEDVAQAIMFLIQNKNIYVDLVERGSNTVKVASSWQEVAQEVQELLEITSESR